MTTFEDNCATLRRITNQMDDWEKELRRLATLLRRSREGGLDDESSRAWAKEWVEERTPRELVSRGSRTSWTREPEGERTFLPRSSFHSRTREAEEQLTPTRKRQNDVDVDVDGVVAVDDRSMREPRSTISTAGSDSYRSPPPPSMEHQWGTNEQATPSLQRTPSFQRKRNVNREKSETVERSQGAVDLVDAGDGRHKMLRVELPADSEKKDVKLLLVDNSLVLTYEVNKEEVVEEEDEGKSRRQSRGVSERIQKKWKLPWPVEPGTIGADYHDGILDILIPETKSREKQQLDIGVFKVGGSDTEHPCPRSCLHERLDLKTVETPTEFIISCEAGTQEEDVNVILYGDTLLFDCRHVSEVMTEDDKVKEVTSRLEKQFRLPFVVEDAEDASCYYTSVGFDVTVAKPKDHPPRSISMEIPILWSS